MYQRVVPLVTSHVFVIAAPLKVERNRPSYVHTHLEEKFENPSLKNIMCE